MPSEETRISLSVQAHTANELAVKMDAVREEVSNLCSRLGLLSQEYLILSEAMRITLEDMNGGTFAPLIQRTFPALNHKGD